MGKARELIGTNIRHIRHKKGLTQEHVAWSSNLSAAYFGLVERGKKNIGIDALERIADVLDVRLTEFFRPVRKRMGEKNRQMTKRTPRPKK